MAKVKITGHASGTGVITVTAPNTSTDRTITLPDTTGTLLDENSSLPAANLTGTLPAISGASLTGLFNPDGAVVFNESGADVDFRVESDTITHALHLDATDGSISNGSGIFKLATQTTATASGWNFNMSTTVVSAAQNAAIKIGNVTASGMILVNDTTITGQACLIVTGGGVVTIAAQTSNHFVSSSSPSSSQYGIYNAGGYVTVKNGKASTVGLSFMTFRTREGQ